MSPHSLSTEVLLAKIRNHEPFTAFERVELVLRLSVPAILAQMTSVLMQYIDASMVVLADVSVYTINGG